MTKISLASMPRTNNYTLLKNSRLDTSLSHNSKDGIFNMKKQKILEWMQSYRSNNRAFLQNSKLANKSKEGVLNIKKQKILGLEQNYIENTINNEKIVPYTSTDIDTSIKGTKDILVDYFECEIGKNPKEYMPKFPHKPFGAKILGNYCVVRNEFKNNKYIEYIELPDSVYRISPFAFYNCPNLKNVFIGKNVTIIADTAFKTFSDVKFRVDKKNKNFASVGGMLFNKDFTKLLHGPFHMLQSTGYPAPNDKDKAKLIWDRITSFGSHVLTNYAYLENIEFPPNLRSVGESVFELFSSDGVITTPKNLNKLSPYMFKNIGFKNWILNDARNCTDCPSRPCPSIYISKAVSIISETAFDSFFGTVEVDKNNKNFSSYNNAIFNKDKSKLIRYISPTLNPNDNHGSAKKFVVPHGTICIANYAFHNSLVEEISIPETVKYIGVGVFNMCKNLKRINFSPRIDLRKFGTFTFYKCDIIKCIEIISSSTYKHWTDNNFSNAFLYAGNLRLTNYIESEGLLPDVPAYKSCTEIVKNIFKLKELEIDEESSWYKKIIKKCRDVAKYFISNGSDNKTVDTVINYFANIYIAVIISKKKFIKDDPYPYPNENHQYIKNYDSHTHNALTYAINATVNVDENQLYDNAYTAACNAYSSSNVNTYGPIDISNHYYVAGESPRYFDKDLDNRLRIRLTFRNNSIISNNKEYPLTNKPNDYFMMIACNLILSAVNETGATSVGPIKLPNRTLMKHFYVNYHIEPKVKNTHPLLSCTSFDNHYHFMKKNRGGNGLNNTTSTLIYIIEPTQNTIDYLTPDVKSTFIVSNNRNKEVGLKVLTKYNKEKCMYLIVKIKSKCINLRRSAEKTILCNVKKYGAVSMHGPLYGNFKKQGIALLNSKYVDKETRERVIEENFLTRIIYIINPTEQTWNTFGKLVFPEIIDVRRKVGLYDS